MDSFTGKLAVVTGGGSGLGRELARQLTAQGCSVAACDLSADAVAETAVMARADARPGVRVSVHHCDVSDEARVLRFRDELLAEHATDHVDLVFSNAGIGGGESFIGGSRQVWERVFAVDWCGDLADLIGEDAKIQDDRRGGARQARGRLRLRQAVQGRPGSVQTGPAFAGCRSVHGPGRCLRRAGYHRTGSRRSGAAVAVTPNLAATYVASSSLVGRHPS